MGAVMQRSEHIHELAAALARAQGQMRAAIKDAANPFFKSRYADLASVIAAVKEPLSAHGLAYAQPIGSDADGHYLETILMHSSGQWIAERVRMAILKPGDPQVFGSTVTYYRRYALQSMVGVPADDDDGNAAARQAKDPGIHRPSDGAAERISEPRRRAVEGVVEAARECLGRGDAAAAAHELAQLTDPDERVYAWTFFDSRDRAAMKKARGK